MRLSSSLPALTLLLGLTALPTLAWQEADPPETDRHRHEQEVMKSRFCAECHPAIYAEHEQSTHGRAFTDEEVRLATGRFDQGDCIICHTPRPIFETGIGMNPQRRHFNLEEGNTCMTCHWSPDHDYSTFQGGAECVPAFDARVGSVEACASCHRNHGTPYQWQLAPLGKGRDRECMECHMELVTRPVAVGMEPRPVRTHVFPGSRSERQLRKAYGYEASVEGNEVVIRIENNGTGHNFPTELKQRSLESVVVVRDIEGNELYRSRMVCRDPYKRPYGLHLPVNTQIPSGQAVEHRVPLKVAAGTVECELHFKLYYPIEDHHPDLSRRLEQRNLVFDSVTPSEAEVVSAPEVLVVTPEQISVDLASPANLVDYARPAIDGVEMTFPEGDSEETILELIGYFQWPVPAGNTEAQRRLAAIGAPAIPYLIEALGSWDNKTWNQAMKVLGRMGDRAVPALVQAATSDQLYIRLHARDQLANMEARDAEGLFGALAAGLAMPGALDRANAAEALGRLGGAAAVPALRPMLTDRDPDVVRAAALALSRLDDKDSIPAMEQAFGRFVYGETRTDLARAMGHLGCATGVPFLLAGLDESDDLLREDRFEAFFALTGWHRGYDPMAPRPHRLAAQARLQDQWSREGGADALQGWNERDRRRHAEASHLVKQLEGVEDAARLEELINMGWDAVPALVIGLKSPPGFAAKRAALCVALGEIRRQEAVPALIAALHDPVLSVAGWACWALDSIRDPEALEAVQRLDRRIRTLVSRGAYPVDAGPADTLLGQTARTRLRLGERQARHDLVNLLFSDQVDARILAIWTLEQEFGTTHGYDAEGPADERRAAAARWIGETD